MTTATTTTTLFWRFFFSLSVFSRNSCRFLPFLLCVYFLCFLAISFFCASLQQGELLSNTAVRVSCFRTLRKWSQLVICCFVFILMDNSIQRIFWFRVLFCAYVIDPLLTPNTGGRVFVCVVFSLVDPC